MQESKGVAIDLTGRQEPTTAFGETTRQKWCIVQQKRFSSGGRYEIVYDTLGDYFRIEDTTKKGERRRFVDYFGNDVSMTEYNGKPVPRDYNEYQRMTHFRIREE